jgi:hypothetical protein
LYLSWKLEYLKPAGTSQTIQAILFSALQKLRTLVTAASDLTAVVGDMVLDGMAVPVGDGRLLGLKGMVIDAVMAPDIVWVMAGEVIAAVIVPERVPVAVSVGRAVGV